MQDNISSHLARVTVKQKISGKTQNPYTVLELTWLLPNDKTYVQTAFLNDEQIALIGQSVSTSQSL